MTARKSDEVNSLFEEIARNDETYSAYVERFSAFSNFIADFEHKKNLLGLTQAEIAEKMNTAQSAVSRFESLKHPPSYDLLRKASEALGDTLFLSPLGSTSVTLPYDLEEPAREAAVRKGISVQNLMRELLRDGLNRERFIVVGSGSMKLMSPDIAAPIENTKEWKPLKRGGVKPCEELAG